MPYIDSTPQDYPSKFEEDNLQDVFAQMLIDNGWTLVRNFYKAAVDTRAYNRRTDQVNYAIARHTIFRNADGKLLGFATISQFPLKYKYEKKQPIRRPHDDTDPNDPNFKMKPTWDEWIKQKYVDNTTRTNLYFYMLEKLPNSNLVKEDGIVSIVTMPGMGGTSFEQDRDRDRDDWSKWWYEYFEGNYHVEDRDYDPEDLIYEEKLLSASPFHVIRSALDIEVLETRWDTDMQEAVIEKADPRVMQSPIVKTTLRAEFLEHINDPLWHTNWWTDSEVRVKGHIDSTTFFLVLQADTAPVWEKNLVPTIPLYFGKVNSLDGDKDEGYALFSGTIPPVKRVDSTRKETTFSWRKIMPGDTILYVNDATKLPEAPALLTINGTEVVKLIEKKGKYLTVERAQLGTFMRAPYWDTGATIARLSTNNASKRVKNEDVVSLFDFDDPGATVGETIYPLLKLYPHHSSNGVDSVMVSRSRFGARYQAHYLSWNAPSNQLPPNRVDEIGKKYPRAYNPVEKTNNYKYQFNNSRYSDKVHSSRIYVVHPEEGVRGYLDKAIGFNSQGMSATNLRVAKQNCPEKVYEMYKPHSIGAVSPLTKLPVTPFRPVGLGIYSEDINPNEVPHDNKNDKTPPGEVKITKVLSPKSQTIDVEFDLPTDKDLKHVNIYLDGKIYATGITGTTYYRLMGLNTGFKPEIKITTVDSAGNESVGITATPIEVS
ncbi:hypothetical protein MYW48_08535 [Bacillus cereus]|uniref:hypothetical protein n=1 Tax=Bacillus cereus group TaxID=86661 RepID=UPI000BFE59BC|nr:MULTISPECIES: hypothetical protein [Bacillus cereus group]PGK40743.1 hypothetical protein CN908_12640 [Bacillus thuringiensis]UPJ18107.1 hypothetical protein MYW48_08535 [Bacillus cereus]